MKSYKIIVFDMDGTLYNLDDVVQMNYDMQCEFLKKEKNYKDEEIKILFNQNHIYPIMQQDSKSCTEFFEKIGLDKEKWIKYREEHFKVECIMAENAVPGSVIELFSKKYKLILLTSNSIKNVRTILKHIDINSTLFSQIICSNNYEFPGVFNKGKAFNYVREKYQVLPSEILSIGDRYETDIKPCIAAGGDGVQLDEPAGLEKVYLDLSHDCLRTCNEYIFEEV